MVDFSKIPQNLYRAVVVNGSIDYVKLVGLSKNNNNEMAEDAGKLLQELLSGEDVERTNSFFGDTYFEVTQTDSNGNLIKTLITDNNGDNIPDRVEQREYGGGDNIVKWARDMDADGNPEEVENNTYYESGFIKRREKRTDYDSNGVFEGGSYQVMDERGKIIESGPIQFGL